MIRVLHIVSSLDGGGVESMLYNYYSNMDNNKYHFDFIVHGDKEGLIEEKFKALGSVVYHVTPKKISLKYNMLEIDRIIKKGDYDIVHSHQNFSSFSSLYLAWKNKVPVRISHAHGNKQTTGINNTIKESILRRLNKLFANYFFSCALGAGRWLHGKKWSPGGRNVLMNNAIDAVNFSYSEEVRKKYRNMLNIEDKKVLLHVGRFSDEKNHLFMIDIMKRLSKVSDKYILMLVGNGEKEQEVKKYVKDKGCTGKVLFLGVRSDIAELMNAADIFILPSKNEGFGITLIEAQSTGLKVFSSEKVAKETDITNLIEYLPITNIDIWVEKILKSEVRIRESRLVNVQKYGYCIKKEAEKYSEWLEKIYDEYIRK